MNKAVFLDRDGVINEDVDHVRSVNDLHMLPGASGASKDLNERGYRVVVVTNQGAIAKGLLEEETLSDIHREMSLRLASAGAHVDSIYYCPHHPDGVVTPFAVVCDCRKPEPGMIKKAAQELDIDLARSFLVGDKISDILAGKRMGVKTILVKSGHPRAEDVAGKPVEPDFIADDLASAVHYIS